MSIYSNVLKWQTWLCGVLAVESLSLITHFVPEFGIIAFSAVILIFTYLSLRSYALGVLIALTELFIGSQGHILSLASYGLPVSLRIALFVILAIIGVWRIFNDDRGFNYKDVSIKHWPIWLWLGLVILSVCLGFLRGYQLPSIFFDANNYLFLLFILPLAIAIKDETFTSKIVQVFIWSVVYLAAKTLLLEYLFTHGDYEKWLPDIYTWLRDARIAEITFTSTGAYRIFMQSQIFLLPAWWLLVWSSRVDSLRHIWRKAGVAGLIASGILISFSRSFWLGWLISAVAYGVWTLWQGEWRVLLRTAMFGTVSVITGIVFIWVSIQIPIPSAGRGSLDLASRLDMSNEAAASSRWNMLQPLWHAIVQSPVVGHGFGSSVTYISDDPRVRAVSPDGTYTTTNFEWGYLDQWLDLGLLGVALIIGIGGYLVYYLVALDASKYLPLALGLVAIYGVHIGTPYLNHPLGLIYVLLLWVLVKYDSSARQFA